MTKAPAFAGAFFLKGWAEGPSGPSTGTSAWSIHFRLYRFHYNVNLSYSSSALFSLALSRA